MAGDLIREVRRAVLPALKADAAVAALVPTENIHPSTTPANPTWPFTRFDTVGSSPLDGTCYAGAQVDFLLHGFAKDRANGGQIVETAEDHAGRIGSAMKLAVHNRRFPVADGSALVKVRSVRLQRDADEAGAYHSILTCRARVLAT